MGKDIDGLIQRAISKCIDDGEYDPVEDWIVDPSLRLCNEALGEAAAEIETLRTQLATANAENARLGRELEEAMARADSFADGLARFNKHKIQADRELTAANERIERLRAVAECLAASQHYSVRGGGADAGRYLADAMRLLEVCKNHNDLNTGGASDAIRSQADAPTKEGAD